MGQVKYQWILVILAVAIPVISMLGAGVQRYASVCGSPRDCAAMREALRVANEKLEDQKYCAETLAGLRKSNALTVKDNVSMYEQLIECGCPPERWEDEKEDTR